MYYARLGGNEMHATLSEKETVASSIYAMKFTPLENKTNPKTPRVNDLSVQGNRTNVVQFTIVATPQEEDLPLGLVFLQGGDYLYQIYNQNGEELERGQLRYEVNLSQKSYTSDVITEKVYGE